MAYENIQKHVKGARPDVIEVLPALMPKVVKRVCRISQIPVYCRRACVGQGRCDVSFCRQALSVCRRQIKKSGLCKQQQEEEIEDGLYILYGMERQISTNDVSYRE